MRSLLIAALVAAGPTLLAPTPALAQNVTTPQVAVRVADLNLATPDGVRLLDQRLHRAVSAVCELDGPATLAAMNRRWACQEAAFARIAPRRDALIAAARSHAPQLASRD